MISSTSIIGFRKRGTRRDVPPLLVPGPLDLVTVVPALNVHHPFQKRVPCRT